MVNGIVIGPFFFKNNFDGLDYLQLINDQIVPVLRQLPHYRNRRNTPFRRIWWAQDGAPCYRRREVTARLTELFGNRVIALNRAVEWPARSPDLTPVDFFLWGYLKSKVFQTPPENLAELERQIREEMNVHRQDRAMIRRAVFDMVRRAQVCIERNGGHNED